VSVENLEVLAMPQGDKDKYTDKQKRQAEHIEEGYEKRGVSDNEAERRAWATVNKMTGGGKKKGGSGHGKPENHEPARRGGHIGGSSQSESARSAAAKKGWATRRNSAKG
jgi:plasmid stabilization system protein ParE